jgi:hypothetical protein
MTTKAELLKQIRVFGTVGTAPAPPQGPEVDRWKDGTPRDPLAALEARIDSERALVDPRYFEANRVDILTLAAMRQQSAADQQDEAHALAGKERIARKMTDLDRVKAQKEAKQARFEAWQAENINRRIDGLEPLPLKEEA